MRKSKLFKASLLLGLMAALGLAALPFFAPESQAAVTDTFYCSAMPGCVYTGLVEMRNPGPSNELEAKKAKDEKPADAPAPKEKASPKEPAPEPEEAFSYESLTIASPAAEETLWNIGGDLNVSLALNPPLQPGHQVRVYFDGNAQMVAGTSFQLNEVWRGVHNLQAEIIDETGRMLIRSRTNRFYVQQTTVGIPGR